MGLAGQQQALSQQQQALAQLTPSLLGQQIATYSTLGAQQQAQEQARLQAQQNLAYQQAYQPLQAAQTLGSRCYGINMLDTQDKLEHKCYSITKCITNWFKCCFNISWYIQSI
jgi:hypothetical protein